MPSNIDKVKDLSTCTAVSVVNIAGMFPSASRGETWPILRGYNSWENVNIMASVFLPVLQN